MKKSDNLNTDFTVTVRVFKYKTDKAFDHGHHVWHPDHEMVFCKSGGFSNRQIQMMSSLMAISHRLEDCLFNDTYEKEIADSGFKLYGYTPEEYYQNKTNAFFKYCKWEMAGLSGVESTQAKILVQWKRPRSERLLWFISQGKCDCDQGRSKPYIIPAGVTGPDGVTSKTSDSLWWRGLPSDCDGGKLTLAKKEKRRLGYCGY